MYVGKDGIMDLSGETNYIFSSRIVKKPKRKLFGDSDFKKKIIERDGNIYTVWDINMQNSYFLGICFRTIKLKSKLTTLKSIK